MTKPAYSLIFIDADDTLFDFGRAERFALERAFKALGTSGGNALGAPLDEAIYRSYDEINKRLWRDYENKLIAQDRLRTERFRLLFEKYELGINEHEFSAKYLGQLTKASFLIEGAEALCEYLHGKYTVAIITNGIGIVQRARIGGSPIRGYIDHIVISEEAGFSKPDARIFTYAENVTGIREKSKMIIIGDSKQSDILGGINYGIDTCWLNAGRIETIPGIRPDYTVESLNEIWNIL